MYASNPRPLHDKNWVEWETNLKYYDDKGIKRLLNLTNHVCNQEDFNKFYKPLRKQSLIKVFKECLFV